MSLLMLPLSLPRATSDLKYHGQVSSPSTGCADGVSSWGLSSIDFSDFSDFEESYSPSMQVSATVKNTFLNISWSADCDEDSDDEIPMRGRSKTAPPTTPCVNNGDAELSFSEDAVAVQEEDEKVKLLPLQVSIEVKNTFLNACCSDDSDSEGDLPMRMCRWKTVPSPESTPKHIDMREDVPEEMMMHCDTENLREEQEQSSSSRAILPMLGSIVPALAAGPCHQMPPMMPAAVVAEPVKQVAVRPANPTYAHEGVASNQAPRARTFRRNNRKKAGSSLVQQQTSVMLRNLPLDMTRVMFVQLLDREGFAGKYDLIYLPRDFKTSANLGYAFVNMQEHGEALKLQKHFTGFSRWCFPSFKRCEAAWSRQQGLAAYIDWYRNNPVMHESVPEEFKPGLFEQGVQIAFPSPTRRLKMPQI